MIKETIEYVDYNGETRKEDFWFNFTKAEVVRLQNSVNGGLSNMLDKIVAERDIMKIQEYFEKILKLAYGEKSLDGKRFIKSEEISEAFSQTEAYSELVIHMLSDSEYAAKLITGMLPPMSEEDKKKVEEHRKAALNA